MKIPFLKQFVGLKEYEKIQKFAEAKQEPSVKETFTYTGVKRVDVKADYVGYYNPAKISFATYDKMIYDYQIAAGLQVIKLPITQVMYQVICSDKKIKTFIEEEMDELWIPLVKSMLTAVDYGFAAHELVWEKPDKNFTLKYAKLVKPETIIIMRHPLTEEYIGLKQISTGTIQKEKALLFSHDVKFGNLYGQSRLRASYEPWYWAHIIVSFCNRYHENFAQPTIVCTAPVGRSQTGVDEDGVPTWESNMDAMQKVGESLQEHSVVTIPSVHKDAPKFDVDFKTAPKAGSQFFEYLRLLDAWKLRGMFIPETVISQPFVGGGSYGLAQTHTDVFMKTEEDLAMSIIDVINKQIIPNLVKYNFGNNAPEVKLEFVGFAAELRKFMQKVYNNMILKGTAIPSADELAKVIGLPNIKHEKIPVQTPKVPNIIEKKENKVKEKKEKKNKKKEVENKKTSEEKYYKGKKLRYFEEHLKLAEIDEIQDDAYQDFLKVTEKLRKKYVQKIIDKIETIYDKETQEEIKDAIINYELPYLEEYTKELKKILVELYEKGIEHVKEELEALDKEVPSYEEIEQDYLDMDAISEAVSELDSDITKRKIYWIIWGSIVKGLAFKIIVDELREKIEKEIAASQKMQIIFIITQIYDLGRRRAIEQFKIKEVIYTAILDKKTCSFCQNLDGTIYVVKSPEYYSNQPPHISCEGGNKCRCMYVFV